MSKNFNVGDKVKVKRNGRTGVIKINDNSDSLPIKIIYDITGCCEWCAGGELELLKSAIHSEKIEVVYNNLETIVITRDDSGEYKKGVAKCNPTDTYDKEYGFLLAYARAKGKDHLPVIDLRKVETLTPVEEPAEKLFKVGDKVRIIKNLNSRYGCLDASFGEHETPLYQLVGKIATITRITPYFNGFLDDYHLETDDGKVSICEPIDVEPAEEELSPKFKVGDLVKGLSDKYGYTNTKMTKGIVKEVCKNLIRVQILEHAHFNGIDTIFGVNPDDFELIPSEPEKPTLKVGDRVKVKDNLIGGRSYDGLYVMHEMIEEKGKYFIIDRVKSCGHFALKGLDWCWNAEILELVEFKVGDVVKVKDDLIIDNEYDDGTRFASWMSNAKGKYFSIENEGALGNYRLKGAKGFYSPSMIEPAPKNTMTWEQAYKSEKQIKPYKIDCLFNSADKWFSTAGWSIRTVEELKSGLWEVEG